MTHQEPPSDKKVAIFESTLNLIRDHGFHGTTMSQVAKNASVAAGTIYHYFESKDQLVCELYSYNRDRVVTIIDDAISTTQTCKETFIAIWSGIYQFYTENPNALIFFEQFINSPYNQKKNPSHFKGPLYDFFKSGADSGHLAPIKPEIAIVLTMSSIASTAKLNNFGNVPLDHDDLKQIIEVLWNGLSKK